ncbi:MAG: hypothetical protein ACHQDY_05020 [Solirubrobacterales bacterium]
MRLSVVSLALATCLLAIPAAGASADACPNETLRSETHSRRLPDCRAYELVTPPYKEGAFVGQLSGMLGLAPDGEHLIGTSLGVFAGSEDGTLGGDSRLRGTAYELSRTSVGWATTALGPPESTYRSAGMYDAGADLSATLWGLGRLTQPEGVSDLYVERPRGTFTEVGPPTPEPNAVNANRYTYLGASADLSHVLFSTEPGFRWPFDSTLGAASTLYEYVGTGNVAPSLVGVSGGAGSTELVSQCGTLLGSSAPSGARGSMYNAVSADGARVFFTAVGRDNLECGGSEPPVDELLVREEVTPSEERTVPISEPTLTYCEESPALPCADAHFEGASQDGSKVFFTSTQKLLPEASEGTANLYEYDFHALAGENLSLASAGAAPAEVQGVARISEDGSHVYFLARGVLSAAPNVLGDPPLAGGENLYVHERDSGASSGHTAFIATLSPGDETDWARADERPVLASAEGRFLVFTSRADLTHEGVAPGVAQVFQYDALTESLVRASIGEPGFGDDGHTPAYGATLATQQADVFDSPTSAVGASAPANGAVFFESPTALTPQALNDQIDGLGEPVPNVYEYRAGAVSLISEGLDTSTVDGSPGVRLLSADPSGNNAFLTTVDPLVAQDTDTQQDIYDARAEGGFPAPKPPPSCSGEACQGPLSTPPKPPVAGGATGSGKANPDSSSAPSPGWAIRSLAQPTDFSAVGNAECEAHPRSQICDSYALLVTNVGSRAAEEGPITVSDTLPPGMRAVGIEGEDLATGRLLSCTQTPLQCVNEGTVPAGDTLWVRIDVVVDPSVTGVVTNSASVAGGGAPAVATSDRTTISSAPAPFGIADFGVKALGVDGTPETQAGGHPFTLTTSFDLTSDNQEREGIVSYDPTGAVKDIVLDLPLGFAVDPQSAPRCLLSALQLTVGKTSCPAVSRIGTLVLERLGGSFSQSEGPASATTAVYNVVPEAGYPMEFGASYLGVPILMYGSVVRMGSGYGLRLAVPGVPDFGLIGASLTLFGDPSERNGGPGPSSPFFVNPVDCLAGSSPARLEADTWQHPDVYSTAAAVTYPQVRGCDALQFQPTLSVMPDTTLAAEPSGYTIDVRVPQNENPSQLSTPELKSATVTLPAGVSLSPAAAGGLVGCPATGPQGIDIAGSESAGSEGSELGPDGLYHTAPGHCPAASTIGTVEIATPLLGAPLEGRVLAACGKEGRGLCGEGSVLDARPVGVYLEVAGSGVVVKLAGTVAVDEATDQLTLAFDELPQLPFSELKVHLKGGRRAVLVNPEACGTATATSWLLAWSEPVTIPVTASSAFDVTECPSVPPITPPTVGSTTPPAASGPAATPPASGTSEGVKSVVTTKPPRKKAGKAKRKHGKHRKRGRKPKSKHSKKQARKAKPKRGDR